MKPQMLPIFPEPDIALLKGDCLEVMKTLPGNSVDAIVTDPPYGISFMGKKWDYDVPTVDVWKECLRVLKPGGHALVACGTRTQHRMAVNIEDAGFELRDIVAWVYAVGFPKSLNIGKALDKKAGAVREVVGKIRDRGGPRAMVVGGGNRNADPSTYITAPATPEAKKYDGYGTNLKPAMELWTLCRKPLSEKTVAENVLKWGVGGLDIDGSRISTEDTLSFGSRKLGDGVKYGKCEPSTIGVQNPQGRFPANFIHSGEEEVTKLFPETGKSSGGGGVKTPGKNACYGKFNGHEYEKVIGFQDSGSAARFFYCAKASRSERGQDNTHPTVKPLSLMKYLVNLITPPDQGTVLDPFMGSGTTGLACKTLNRNFIGIEKDAEYFEICKGRIR